MDQGRVAFLFLAAQIVNEPSIFVENVPQTKRKPYLTKLWLKTHPSQYGVSIVFNDIKRWDETTFFKTFT